MAFPLATLPVAPPPSADSMYGIGRWAGKMAAKSLFSERHGNALTSAARLQYGSSLLKSPAKVIGHASNRYPSLRSRQASIARKLRAGERHEMLRDPGVVYQQSPAVSRLRVCLPYHKRLSVRSSSQPGLIAISSEPPPRRQRCSRQAMATAPTAAPCPSLTSRSGSNDFFEPCVGGGGYCHQP